MIVTPQSNVDVAHRFGCAGQRALQIDLILQKRGKGVCFN